jgi:Pro-kumamolisin, activation domain
MMAQRHNYTPVAGSEHHHPKEHKKMKPAADEEMTMVALILGRREGARMRDVVDLMPGTKGAEKKPSRKEIAERRGADPQEMKIVEKFARAHHLEIIESHPGRRAVVMRGKVEDINKAFGVTKGLISTPALKLC